MCMHTYVIIYTMGLHPADPGPQVARQVVLIIIIIIIMFIDCKWVDTRWQWSFNMLHVHGLLRLII